MDTSPEYIKQCEKAEEIQSLWKPDRGDYCVERILGQTFISLLYFDAFGCLATGSYEDEDGGTGESVIRNVSFNGKEATIWLPTQSQLQEMTELKVAPLIIRIYDFWDEHSHEPYAYNSMEQLWLSFVMKEKYNKVWVNGEWVKP